MVQTRGQLENLSKEELIKELMNVEGILNYLISIVILMIFWVNMKLFLQSELLVKTVTPC